jgi:hypothetical protein
VNKSWTATLAATALGLCVCCHASESEEPEENTSVTEAPQHPAAPASAPAPVAGKLTGSVVETMDSGGYTYVLVDTGDQTAWAAGPQISVTPGDEVTFDTSMPMADYHSDTLDRTFETIYFTGAIERAAPEETDAVVEPIAPAEGGVTVEEIFTRRADLVGEEVVLRGEVVKFNAQILGKNWLHLRDGTGAEGTNDVTITTSATVAVGDTVLVRGVLAADRDFGYGYVYDLIVEDAEVRVE